MRVCDLLSIQLISKFISRRGDMEREREGEKEGKRGNWLWFCSGECCDMRPMFVRFVCSVGVYCISEMDELTAGESWDWWRTSAALVQIRYRRRRQHLRTLNLETSLIKTQTQVNMLPMRQTIEIHFYMSEVPKVSKVSEISTIGALMSAEITPAWPNPTRNALGTAKWIIW